MSQQEKPRGFVWLGLLAAIEHQNTEKALALATRLRDSESLIPTEVASSEVEEAKVTLEQLWDEARDENATPDEPSTMPLLSGLLGTLSSLRSQVELYKAALAGDRELTLDAVGTDYAVISGTPIKVGQTYILPGITLTPSEPNREGER
jgi:hypothetical protein